MEEINPKYIKIPPNSEITVTTEFVGHGVFLEEPLSEQREKALIAKIMVDVNEKW